MSLFVRRDLLTEWSHASSPAERAAWARVKALPHLLQAPLTEDQELSIDLHILIDDGYLLCTKCQQVTASAPWCANCGCATGIEGHVTAPGKCSKCQSPVRGKFCGVCGLKAVSDKAEELIEQIRTNPTAAAEEAAARTLERRRKLEQKRKEQAVTFPRPKGTDG